MQLCQQMRAGFEMARYFGTNGVRGRFNELDPQLALRLAQAIGSYFSKGKIVVARDGRLTGEVLRSAVISGLASVGCSVVDLGIESSPTAEFMARKLKADGLIIITASHNPPEWNALKVVDGKGVAVSKERGEEIESMMEKIKLSAWDRVGSITSYGNGAADHSRRITELVDAERIKKRKPKLVLDCGSGTAAVIAPKLFRELGCEVLTINDKLDGRFPGRPSEPTEANVKKLIETVKSGRADAGIAWDGDGDRVIFVDEKGSYVIGDKVFALCALWKLAEKKGDVITTVATSRMIEEIAERYGCKVRYTAIGAPYLCEEVTRGGAVIAGEEVGGVIYPEISLAKDGMMAAAKMVEKVCEKPLGEWVAELPVYCNVKKKIDAEGKEKKDIVTRVKQYAKKNGMRYLDVDGVRIDFEDSWVIVRPSGTEPYVRLFAEAKSKENAQELADFYTRIASG